MPRLARITVYPIKSFDGTTLDVATFTEGGGLTNDRRFAFRVGMGDLVNGKKFPAIHSLRTEFSADFTTVTFSFPEGTREVFQLVPGNSAFDRRMSDYLGVPVHLEENAAEGFMDDPDSP